MLTRERGGETAYQFNIAHHLGTNDRSFRKVESVADMRNLPALLAGAFALAASASASAHHSAAMFDHSKLVDVTGTVKEFHWTNPHSWLLLESRDASGKAVEFSVEANGPGYLVRSGWKRESLKPGDNVTVTINPLRDGTRGGNLVKAVLANGQELSAMPKIAGLSFPAEQK